MSIKSKVFATASPSALVGGLYAAELISAAPNPHCGGDSTPRLASMPPPIAERITVALVAKAADDLQVVYDRTPLSKTDIVNRALSLYEFIDAELNAGAELIVRRDGEDQVVKLL